MKYNILIISIFASILFSCGEEEYSLSPGNPNVEVKSQISGAAFGDSLPFTVSVNDNVDLSVLTASLYFGEEKVSETKIRTKTAGDYSGKIFVPYYKDIPNGNATLEFEIIDTHMSKNVKSVDVPIVRPEYPYLILVTAEKSYPMTPTGNPYEYAATEAFPSTDLSAYIKTPVLNEYGNEITFGWEAGAITQGSIGEIPFSSAQGGVYSVVFNTRTYAAAPFFELTVNGDKMTMADKENFRIDMDVTQGQKLTVEGITDIADWWIDPDFFTKSADNEFTFVPISGRYRITANIPLKYFKVEVLSGNSLATLQPDGTGAIWVIGLDVGKPSVAQNEVGWNAGKGLCMAPVGNKKYQLTLVAGETVNTQSVNFKFFYQNDWGGEFKGADITSSGDLIYVNNPSDGSDDGNLRLFEGKTLEEGATYVFVVDVSAGLKNATLSVVKK
ncbi:MAG: DUF5125 domain-containing protein [Tannerella sp.]|jgi:hypothetical protein|nr:DUF5125 domain-containing protein [Tannerella sp.]